MSNHLNPTQLRGFLQRDLPAQEILMLDKHIAQCTTCSGIVALAANRRAARRLLQGIAPAEAHLAYGELEAFVDQKASPAQREAVKAHTAACRRCAAELSEMQAYAPALSQPPVTLSAPSPTWAERLWAWLPGQMALGTALAVLAGVVALTVVFRQESVPSRPDNAALLEGKPGLERRPAPAAADEFDRSALDHLDAVSPEAMTALVSGDFAALARILRPAAERGNTVAQSALGLLAAEGKGTAVDLKTAKRLWMRAAEHGDTAAAHNLGVLNQREQGAGQGATGR